MTATAILVTLMSSLISGIVGVVVATRYFYKLERHKLKLDLARRLLGNRYDLKSKDFSCAMNELLAVFSDSEEVLAQLKRIDEALRVHDKPNVDSALIDLFKAVCKASGLSQNKLNDAFLLSAFNAQ